MKAILLSLFLLPFMMFSQTPAENINDMKNGVILVRLMTREKSIQALKDAGHHEKAQAVVAQQKEENFEITKAFKENFDFCPVMFFYSSCTRQVRDREFQDCLLDANLDPLLEEDTPAIDKFFIAEFGHVERSDEQNFSHYSLEYDDQGDQEVRKNYQGDTDIGVDALVIRDADFIQLRDPFPYYARTREGLPWKRSKEKTVAKMNKNLHEYYKERR